MNISSRFNSLACLTVLFGLLMFCLADDRPGLAVLSVVVCILGWLAGGAGGGWRPVALPRLLVNLLVLATILNAAYRASRAGGGQPIVSHLGEFLVYIQLLKLFDRRTSRDESQLLTLSLFVVIAAMLTSNALPVGLCLIAYTPLAIASAMLFQVRAGQRRAAAPDSPAGDGSPAAGSASATEEARLVAGRRAASHFRWVAATSLAATAAIAAAIFIVTPRGLGAGALGRFGEGRGGAAATGFNERVELGQRGYLGDNTEPVLDLLVEDASGANVGSPDRVYYLRGVTRNRYQDSIWTAWTGDVVTVEVEDQRSPGRAEPIPLEVSSSSPSELARTTQLIQHITIRSPRGANPVMFAIWRPLAISAEPGTRLDVVRSDVTIRRNGSTPTDLAYTVYSSPIDGDTGRRPRRPTAFTSGPIHDLAVSLLEGARVPVDPFERDRPASRQAVNILRSYLQDNYTYTREMVAPGAGQDPIEMFLFDTRRGHCEYFASAMVALCQSVGIPARLVIGYVAADFNSVTGKYIVRQSNAHAWAEVYVGEPLPPPGSPAPESTSRGTWQMVDPSPPGDIAAIHRAERGWLAALRHWYETIEFGWNRSIVGFDAANQRSSAVGRRLNLEGLDRFFDDLSGRLFVTAKTLSQPDGSSLWQTWLLPTMLVGTAAAALLIRRRLIGQATRSSRRRTGNARGVIIGDGAGHYGKALRILRRAGLEKPPDRPPIAHGRRLAESGCPAGSTLESIARLYYAARFGGRRLSSSEDRAARELIEQLRTGLRAGVRSNGASP